MADIQPFRGLRYNTRRAGDPAGLISPPYDIISPEQQAALHERSPWNVVRLELAEQREGDTPADNRYTRAAACLRRWLSEGILRTDDRPRFYAYHQEFQHRGRWFRRRTLMARLRLEEWERGVVRPHEGTMAGPKEDRLELLRHLRVNVSPVFVLYRDPESRLAQAVGAALQEPPLLDAQVNGQRHTLEGVTPTPALQEALDALRDACLYIADGHHRYETALAYRDERRAQATAWTGEEPENFVLVGLTAAEDPGLVLLPTHRLVRPPSLPDDLLRRLAPYFHLAEIDAGDAAAVGSLPARPAKHRPSLAIGAAGLVPGRLHILTLKDPERVQSLMPADRSAAWRSLDVSVLEYAVVGATLGIAPGSREHEEQVQYTENAAEALRAVEEGRYPLAFLLNPTPVESVLAVADAGDRMPQKSTFFYPKLGTGLVMYPLD